MISGLHPLLSDKSTARGGRYGFLLELCGLKQLGRIEVSYSRGKKTMSRKYDGGHGIPIEND